MVFKCFFLLCSRAFSLIIHGFAAKVILVYYYYNYKDDVNYQDFIFDVKINEQLPVFSIFKVFCCTILGKILKSVATLKPPSKSESLSKSDPSSVVNI